MPQKVKVAIDFDGVLHSFSSGWQGHRKISDPPVPDAIWWLWKLLIDPNVDVSIFSARIWWPFGKRRMKKWLLNWGLTKYALKRIKWWYRKPPCDVLIDDRCICFTGQFPSVKELQEFKPWHGHGIFGDEDNGSTNKK